MICRLCLKDSTDYIDMFAGTSDYDVNIAGVIAKYFWFEPTAEDPVSKKVCQQCWSKVWDFHEFYLLVEEANRQYLLLGHSMDVKKEEDDDNMIEQMPVHVRLMEHVDLKNEEIKSCNILAEELIDNPMDINDGLEETNEEFLEDADSKRKESNSGNALTDGFMNDPMELSETSTSNEELLQVAIEVKSLEFGANFVKEKQPRQSKKKVKKKSYDEGESKPLEDTMSLAKLKKKMHARKSKKNTNIKCHDEGDCNNEDAMNNEDTDDTELKSNADESQLKEQSMTEKEMRRIDQIIAQHTALSCLECGLNFETFAYLSKHMKKKHQIEKGYIICCDRKFTSRRSIFAHAQTAINPESYKCEICGKRLYNSFNLRKHMLTKHQPEEAKNFECKHCPKRFATGYLLKKHAITHDERSHICDICQKGFQSAGILAQHKKITHEGYGIMCDICAKVFPGRAVFEKHQLVHRDVPLKLQCNICLSWHKGPDSLRMHKSMHNQEGQVHMCSHCGKMSPNRVAMLKHIRDVHTSERKYQCTYCEKAFKRAIHLKEHLSSHTGEALYTCPHCSRTFNSNSNMHSHRKKMHPVEFEETRRQQLEMRKMPPPEYEASTSA